MDIDSYSEKARDYKTSLTKYRELPRLSVFGRTLEAFSPGERLIFYTLATILTLCTLALFAQVNSLASVVVPAPGGSHTEGVVGPARFVNPLLAISGPDKDLAELVYSGLMRATPDGRLIPDLAERYEISEDGTTYTFTLRDGLTFHDGTPLTAEDVLFTIQRAQNADFKSTQRADWEGVTVAAEDARTIVFTLPHAYGPFLENMTLGILPKHLWENVTAEEFPFHSLNTHPIGSGPYEVKDVDTDATGAVTRYRLTAFKKFALGTPYIKDFSFVFYPNEEALVSAFNAGRIDGFAGISPADVANITRSDAYIVHAPLPRTFGIFFNQNKNATLTDAAVRKALDAAVNKENIVSEVLKGYGVTLDGPIPPGILGSVNPATPEPLVHGELVDAADQSYAERGKSILSENGWTFDKEKGTWNDKDGTPLSLTLVTADEPELAATAEAVARDWRAVGINVEIHVYPISELNAVVLRPRNYEAVLFGEVVGRALDLFAFWHSSQRNDPGLNLALYTNSKADTLLAEGRATTREGERERLYGQFAAQVANDRPAVFLYAPEFIYVVPKVLKGVEIGALTTPAERFLNVYEWHTNTERVWNIFTNNTEL